MTELSPRFALPLLQSGQAQKELYHNEALMRIDTVMHPVVAERGTVFPPAAPAIGASWIVAAGAGGVWAGHNGAIATWSGGGWRFTASIEGMRVWLADRKRWAWHDGFAWRDDALPTAGIAVNGITVVGPRRPPIAGPSGGDTVDTEARLTLSMILTALRGHGLIDT